MKPNIFYFVHTHGSGHKATFHLLYPALSQYFTVIAVVSNPDITGYLQRSYGVEVVELPAKYPAGYAIPEHTFSKPFEVTPYAVEPAVRAEFLAAAVRQYRPAALYCDGVPELAIMARGMGVPVVLVRLPGNTMVDPTQVFAYECADHIVAHFPGFLEQPGYSYEDKTLYSGYLSKYAAAEQSPAAKQGDTITILLGSDAYDEQTLRTITSSNYDFMIIGNKHNYALGPNCTQLGRVADIAAAIDGTVVISAAGQNSVAELLSLQKRLILLPEPRPYDEQSIHADMLAKSGIALRADYGFTTEQWTDIIRQAISCKPSYGGLFQPEAPDMIARQLKEWYA